MKKVHLAVGTTFLFLFAGSVHSDELVSLDDPAPAARAAPKRAGAKPAAKPAAKAAPPAAGLENLDSLDSLDETSAAPAGDAPADLGSSGGDAEVALDLGGEDSFAPYTFARTAAWGFLPIAALILVGLHLIPVPKRKSKRKIDQARRFFRGISGEATNSAIMIPPKGDKK